jgi:hypothetical protein
MHDIDEIRRKAMGVLEKEAGGPVAGMSHSQWANLRAGARRVKKYLRFAIDMVFAYR